MADDPSSSTGGSSVVVRHRGFGFAEFATVEAAAATHRAIANGALVFDGRVAQCDWAREDEEALAHVKAVFARGIKLTTSDDVIRPVFERAGSITNYFRTQTRDSAFVHYATRDDALRAIRECHGVTVGEGESACTLDVQLARPQRKKIDAGHPYGHHAPPHHSHHHPPAYPSRSRDTPYPPPQPYGFGRPARGAPSPYAADPYGNYYASAPPAAAPYGVRPPYNHPYARPGPRASAPYVPRGRPMVGAVSTRPMPGEGYKTRLCVYFMRGACRDGATCNFAHGDHELRAAAPAGAPMPQMTAPQAYASYSPEVSRALK